VNHQTSGVRKRGCAYARKRHGSVIGSPYPARQAYDPQELHAQEMASASGATSPYTWAEGTRLRLRALNPGYCWCASLRKKSASFMAICFRGSEQRNSFSPAQVFRYEQGQFNKSRAAPTVSTKRNSPRKSAGRPQKDADLFPSREIEPDKPVVGPGEGSGFRSFEGLAVALGKSRRDLEIIGGRWNQSSARS